MAQDPALAASAQDTTTMADKEASRLSSPSNETLRLAAGQFEYANRVSVGGNYGMAIQLMRTCCKLVPTNFAYRQALRKVEKTKYKNNLHGSMLAPMTTFFARLRIWRAARRKDHLKVLEHGEAILAKNPWDKSAQLLMADAALALNLPVLAIWTLQQAREKDAKDAQINRALARMLEQQGHLSQAIVLWDLVRKACPADAEAQTKARQLAATETITRGNYEEAMTGETTVRAASDKSKQIEKKTSAKEQTPRPPQEPAPTNPEHYLKLASRHVRAGQLEEARAVLQRGLEATGQAFELTVALADLEIEPLRQKLAKAEESLRDRPEEGKVQQTCERLRAEINSRELALFREKAQHDPADRNHRIELGVRLLRAGQVDEAISELQAARSDGRLRWKAQMHLGQCFLARQNWPLARRNLEEALGALPENEEGHRKELLLQLARGCANAGELPRAIEVALDLADLDYAYGNIGRLLEEWQSRAQKTGTS